MSDFVEEVELCCDLNHPNLARLLGYSEQPRLMMVQELLMFSLDQLLYTHMWKPSLDEILKSALDVARGMAYLHTAFEMQSNHHAQPIIHRDLKSPNLLLATDPLAGEEVLMKITDFGLSRDKGMGATFNQTVAMTGCGSVLWMAPEILRGQKYNEKVDVFAYAMCLVELVGREVRSPRNDDEFSLKTMDFTLKLRFVAAVDGRGTSGGGAAPCRECGSAVPPAEGSHQGWASAGCSERADLQLLAPPRG